jgi:hypothetical protein
LAQGVLALQVVALQVQQPRAVVCAQQFTGALLDAADFSAILADRPFVGEIGFAMVADAGGGDRAGGWFG